MIYFLLFLFRTTCFIRMVEIDTPSLALLFHPLAYFRRGCGSAGLTVTTILPHLHLLRVHHPHQSGVRCMRKTKEGWTMKRRGWKQGYMPYATGATSRETRFTVDGAHRRETALATPRTTAPGPYPFLH